MHVSDVMTKEVRVLREDEALRFPGALEEFRAASHIPVLDKASHLVGVVSRTAAVEAAAKSPGLVPVSALMQTDWPRLSPDDELKTAAQRMRQAQVQGMAVVGSDGTLRGMVTETDLLAGLAGGPVQETFDDLPVEVVMTPTPLTLRPEERLAEAARLMVECGVRHLPVVDAERHVLGIISETDIRAATRTKLGRLASEPMGILSQPISAVMTPSPAHVTLGGKMKDVLTVFGQRDIGAILVTDGLRHAVGIVSYLDVLDWIRRTALAVARG